MDKLDAEDQEEYREAFALFDKNKDGRINGKELSELMRYLGTIYGDGEIMDMIREIGGVDSIDQNQFLSLMSKRMSTDSSVEEMLMAFRVFDKDGTGTISVAELRFVMTSLGDKLDDDQVEEMLKTADPSGSGGLAYEPFVRSMLKQ